MLSAKFLKEFSCLGDRCEDTCCKGWGMQVDEATYQKYCNEAPELADAVTSGEADHIMKRDPETDYCIKFENGWCGVHREKGTEFLGDACHFFPRITRSIGKYTTQTASLSCPEVARLTLLQEHPFALENTEDTRLPYSLKDYQPEELTDDEALETHVKFIESIEDVNVSAERILCRRHSVAESLASLPMKSWPEAVPFYMKTADSRLATPEINHADPFNLFHALVGLVGAAKKTTRKRLDDVLEDMQSMLDVSFDDKGTLTLSDNSLESYRDAQEQWQCQGEKWQPILKRWIQAQLSISLFPFAGLGETLSDRITIIIVRFATFRLALMAQLSQNGEVTEDDIVRISQSLARFMDHLADPSLSMDIYKETGWNKTARAVGMLEGSGATYNVTALS